MAEYIDRAAFGDTLCRWQSTLARQRDHEPSEVILLGSVINLLNAQEAEDVAPVRHAKWMANQFTHDYTKREKVDYRPYIHCAPFCSACGVYAPDDGDEGFASNYCPNCGAKMDGDPDEGS